MTSEARLLLAELLPQVSRSFYLTIRILPAAVRPQIGLAYLLARATDTIADTELVAVEQRLEALRLLRDRVLNQRPDSLAFGELVARQATSAERILLERIEEVLRVLNGFSPEDQKLIRDVLATITSGQELDLQRFPSSTVENISLLGTDPELEDYTYRVAGCVGEFWTRICRRHLFPHAPLDEVSLIENAIRFGQGLQLVNILRDLPADLRKSRCYLPAERLAEHSLTASDLLNPANEPRLRPLYNRYLDSALAHLEAGWTYTNSLPRSCVRIRLACAWPILIGVRTINRLRVRNVLDGTQRVKISRPEVRSIIFQTAGLYPFPQFWRGLFDRTVRSCP